MALEREVRDRDSTADKRLLRYVYLGDGTFWNGLMVREGYARAGCWEPDCKYSEYLEALQEEAEVEGVGGWSECKGEAWWAREPETTRSTLSAPSTGLLQRPTWRHSFQADQRCGNLYRMNPQANAPLIGHAPGINASAASPVTGVVHFIAPGYVFKSIDSEGNVHNVVTASMAIAGGCRRSGSLELVHRRVWRHRPALSAEVGEGRASNSEFRARRCARGPQRG